MQIYNQYRNDLKDMKCFHTFIAVLLISGLINIASAQDAIDVQPDITRPSVEITVPSGTQNGAFDVTITFSKSVSDFVQDDLSLEGSTATATITAWSADTDNDVYTATITPTTSGTVVLNVAADVATDAADNANTAATEQTVTVLVVVIPDANFSSSNSRYPWLRYGGEDYLIGYAESQESASQGRRDNGSERFGACDEPYHATVVYKLD